MSTGPVADCDVPEGLVVDAGRVFEWLGRPDVAVLDTRSAVAYREGHIPGAANLPAGFLIGPLGDPISPALLSRQLQRSGIARDDIVVAVDEMGGQGAALLLWILHLYGHDAVQLLSGGWAAWVEAAYPAESGPSGREPADYELGQGPPGTVLALAEDVRSDGSIQLVDSRSAEEFGADEGSHIPGAINVEWTRNLQVTPNGAAWRSRGDLVDLYRSVGVNSSRPVVAYCHSGPRATVTYVALREAGFQNVSVYFRGWREWEAQGGPSNRP